jgi:FkbM family methyltransferase
VVALQQLLNRATAARLTVDGVLGPVTRAAVATLQRRLELPRTGEADPLTLVLAQARIEDGYRRQDAPRRFLLDLPTAPEADAPPRRRHLLIEVAASLFIPRVLEERGLAGYEPETLACFLAVLSARPDGVFLDVGANVGLFSVLAASLSDWRVVGFEPTPRLAAGARQICRSNSLDVRLEELALGRETGAATFYLSDVSDCSNSLAAGFRPATSTLVVPVERLDEWAARTGCVPDLIKIDTETTEPDVLAGGREVLRRDRPWLLCEVLPGHRTQELIDELAPLGYSWYHIQDDGPLTAATDLDATGPGRNWLFAPEPVTPAFQDAVTAWRKALAALPSPAGAG